MPHALITGASAGLGLALARTLAERGWALTVDGRRPDRLDGAARSLRSVASAPVTAVCGDVADPHHRADLVARAAAAGPVELLVNNASELGGSPPPALRELDSATFERLWRTNVDAPLQLLRLSLPHLAPGAVIVNVSSDAAVEHYEGWGGYAATKAALDHLTLTWAAEEPGLTWYAVDPGDLRTELHQAAFPGEDISDRPEPESVVPRLLALVGSGWPSGRYRATDVPAAAERIGA